MRPDFKLRGRGKLMLRQLMPRIRTHETVFPRENEANHESYFTLTNFLSVCYDPEHLHFAIIS